MEHSGDVKGPSYSSLAVAVLTHASSGAHIICERHSTGPTGGLTEVLLLGYMGLCVPSITGTEKTSLTDISPRSCSVPGKV